MHETHGYAAAFVIAKSSGKDSLIGSSRRSLPAALLSRQNTAPEIDTDHVTLEFLQTISGIGLRNCIIWDSGNEFLDLF